MKRTRRIVGKVFRHENYKITHFPNSTSGGSDALKNQRKEESRSVQTGQLRKNLHTAVEHLGTSVLHSK